MAMPLTILTGDLGDPRVRALLEHHAATARAETGRGSAHALGVDGLMSPDITLWTAWADDALVGVGALKRLSDDHVEIKSMHTAQQHRRSGVARAMLLHIIAAIVWVGGTVLFFFYIEPTITKLGPDAEKFVAEFINRRKVPQYFAIASTLTVVGGLFLYYHDQCGPVYAGAGRTATVVDSRKRVCTGGASSATSPLTGPRASVMRSGRVGTRSMASTALLAPSTRTLAGSATTLVTR